MEMESAKRAEGSSNFCWLGTRPKDRKLDSSELDTITARFVGGPWHNRIETVSPSPIVVVRYKHPLWSWAQGAKAVSEHHYFLAEFESDYFDTVYFQYVHRSLVDQDGFTHDKASRERFRKWVIDGRELEDRLLTAMGSKFREN